MSSTTSQGLPRYDNPPVIEVVCGILFRSIEELLAPHLGLLWEKFRPEYSTCQEVPLIAPAIERFDDSPQQVQLQVSNKPSLPRVWFLHADGSIIQVQRDRFLYNWKRLQPEDEYPNYSEVVEKFQNYLTSFQEFLREQELGVVQPLQYEMTYVNHIPEGEGWRTTSDTGAVFPDFAWQSKSPRGDAQRFLSPPEGINWRMSFVLPDNLSRLHVHIQKGQLQNTQRVFRFELTARGIGENKSLEAMPNWFDFAHESIVRGFADLTSYQVQRDIWQLREG